MPTYLSIHFTEEEMTVTQTGKDNSIPKPEDFVVNGVQVDVRSNLKTLVANFLEPLRKAANHPLHINSGFRSKAVNDAVPGSAKNSAHSFGCAADVAPIGGDWTVRAMLVWCRDNLVGWDQLIDEQKGDGPGWLHIGLPRPGFPRRERQCLVMRNGVYSIFNDVEDEPLKPVEVQPESPDSKSMA